MEKWSVFQQPKTIGTDRQRSGFDEKRKKDIAAITVNGGCDDDGDGDV